MLVGEHALLPCLRLCLVRVRVRVSNFRTMAGRNNDIRMYAHIVEHRAGGRGVGWLLMLLLRDFYFNKFSWVSVGAIW